MRNIFRVDGTQDAEDKDLVATAQTGDRAALDALIKKHQGWIYNISVRMVGSQDDAHDVAQEILIKMITKLSTFQHKSSFRTWLYRIVTNHVINRKRNFLEHHFYSFERHTDFKDSLDSSEFPDTQHASVEAELLVEETKSLCLTGMLLCLDRTQRIVFILGSILGIDSKLGGEFLEISPDNFRKILSRARKQLSNFMNEQCGLINENNSCRCSSKTRACIEVGIVNPDKLRFNKDHILRVKNFVSDKIDMVDDAIDDALEMKVQTTFRNLPLLESGDLSSFLHALLKQKDIDQIINFDEDKKRV
jgi:RNA polymerase sigma factor (sigma-70 family)